MSRLLLDYNPLTGETVEFEYNDSAGKVVLHHSQDVTNILEHSKELALNDDYTRKGVKKDMFHYACIPNSIMQEMKTKHNVDWFDKNDKNHKKFFRCLNEHYPYFKTTSWKHE